MNREDLKQKVFDLVASSQKRLKPGDLAKSLARSLGIDKREVHEAIRELTSEGRLIYTYAGHSWLELPADSQ
jgi:Mn-dependent DtxR family transcriptional regulator